ncbi:hypothetical protein FISHEDRAFT_68481 [Fistulina hepatica ATCC 64428]|uniref:Uncharacterized protein n=1 Tax=Fistulina hepatica ATCC 64428 TaxID=1128425 RepID=A0A0D7AQT7_9AGAR|nr:hypothetical protein FISHEDRAFT_68481 [Fistulina hepatica ATCC 64428]
MPVRKLASSSTAKAASSSVHVDEVTEIDADVEVIYPNSIVHPSSPLLDPAAQAQVSGSNIIVSELPGALPATGSTGTRLFADADTNESVARAAVLGRSKVEESTGPTSSSPPNAGNVNPVSVAIASSASSMKNRPSRNKQKKLRLSAKTSIPEGTGTTSALDTVPSATTVSMNSDTFVSNATIATTDGPVSAFATSTSIFTPAIYPSALSTTTASGTDAQTTAVANAGSDLAERRCSTKEWHRRRREKMVRSRMLRAQNQSATSSPASPAPPEYLSVPVWDSTVPFSHSTAPSGNHAVPTGQCTAPPKGSTASYSVPSVSYPLLMNPAPPSDPSASSRADNIRSIQAPVMTANSSTGNLQPASLPLPLLVYPKDVALDFRDKYGQTVQPIFTDIVEYQTGVQLFEAIRRSSQPLRFRGCFSLIRRADRECRAQIKLLHSRLLSYCPNVSVFNHPSVRETDERCVAEYRCTCHWLKSTDAQAAKQGVACSGKMYIVVEDDNSHPFLEGQRFVVVFMHAPDSVTSS